MAIYLDNAATTQTDERVAEAMSTFLTQDYGNPSSAHKKGEKAREAVEQARRMVAAKIGAFPEEMVFTSGGTESNNVALQGAARANRQNGHKILVSAIEHPSVLETAKALQKEGFEVRIIPVDKEGIVKLEELEKEIDEDTILVSIMHANNEIGTVQPVEEIGKLCREKGVLFHTDCVQSFLKEEVNVKKMNIDLASFSAHKIHGPKGTGALYVRNGVRINPIIYGGPHERELRAGTENVPGIIGFVTAVKIWNPEFVEQVRELRDALIEEVLKIDGTKLNGSRTKRLCNNAHFSFKNIEAEALVSLLNEKGICVSIGSACTTRKIEPSHVLKAIGLSLDWAIGSIRATLSKNTTKEEIEVFAKELKESMKQLSKPHYERNLQIR